MKKIIILGCLFLFSCVEKAQEITIDGNFQLEFLFEKDGCKIYRFKDGYRYIYWSNCKGKIQADYETGGKTKTKYKEETITSY